MCRSICNIGIFAVGTAIEFDRFQANIRRTRFCIQIETAVLGFQESPVSI